MWNKYSICALKLLVVPAQRLCSQQCETCLILTPRSVRTRHILQTKQKRKKKISATHLSIVPGRNRQTGFMFTLNKANLESAESLNLRTSIRIGVVAANSCAALSHSSANCLSVGSLLLAVAIAREFSVTATVPLYGAAPSTWLK